MSWEVFVVLALAGGFGAVCRFLVDGVVTARRARRARPARASGSNDFPWGTTVVNLTGSLLLGLLTGLAAGHVVPEVWHVVVGSGFLGGYTTFSAASVETVRLLQERRRRAALLQGLGVLVVTTAAAGLGLWVGSLP